MKRPAFQFYPADWRQNANLRRCSPAARGVWMNVMCLMHDSDEYGLLRWPLKEIAQAAGASMTHVRELADKGVLKGADKGECGAYIYTPRSGRKDGAPVTLIPTQAGPIWYSSRMVKDEYVRTIRGESGGSGETPKLAPKPPFGEDKGGGFGPRGSSSSSSPSVNTSVPHGTGASAPPPAVQPHIPAPANPPVVEPSEVIFGLGVPMLTEASVSDRNARSMLGLMRKQHGDTAVIDALRRCADEKPLAPVAWLQAALKAKPQANKREAVENDNRSIADRFIAQRVTPGGAQ